MDDNIEVISDGDGLAVIGERTAVERFLSAHNLPSRELPLPQLKTALAAGGAIAEVGAMVAERSGRWVKLTRESAAARQVLPAMQGSSDGVSRAVLTRAGKTEHILEFVKSPLSSATSPAALTGLAGVMAQVAMQQTMDEITDYLATIDEKVDDILRAQKDAVLSRMIGAGLIVDEAMTIREHGGRVNAVTWSKVESVPGTLAETQAYALRQLDALAEKLESKRSMGDLADAAKKADETVQEWLAVLARCFQLQDAIAVLELDRVLDAAPDDLEAHRRGLRAAREDRRALISGSTERLLVRLDAAAAKANTKVLLNPMSSGTVVRSSNQVAVSVVGFRSLLGIDEEHQALEARRWAEAAGEVRDKAVESGVAARDKALETGAAGWGVVERRGGQVFGQARAATSRLSSGVTGRMRRLRRDDEAGPGTVDPAGDVEERSGDAAKEDPMDGD